MNGDYGTKLREAMEHINRGCRVLSGGPMAYYLERNEEIVKEFYKRCAPFHVGDVVEITVEIDFEKAYGWAGYKHLLGKGARGRVR